MEQQGFHEGDPFRRAVVGIALDFEQVNPAWAPPGVIPFPVDDKMGERLSEALKVAAKVAPLEAQAGLQALAEPRSIAMMAGVVGEFVAVQLTPAGWVADAVGGALALGTALLVGLDVLTLLSDLNTFIEGVSSPRGDPEKAGHALARVLGQLSVDALVALLTLGLDAAAKFAKRFVQAQSEEVDVLTSGGGVVRISKKEAAGIKKGDNLDSIRSPEGTSDEARRGGPENERLPLRDVGAGQRPDAPFPGEEGPEGHQRMIFTGRADLTPRQQGLLAQLPEFGSRVEVPAAEIREMDISALTAKTGDEFAYFSRGNRVLLVRGGPQTVPITPDISAKLADEGWRWNAHTQPGDTPSDCRSSLGDRAVLQAMEQHSSRIYNSVGESRMFTSDGDSLAGWLP